MWRLLPACGVVDCGGYEAGTRVCIQLWVSGVVPCWMPVRCSRSCMVIAPASLLLNPLFDGVVGRRLSEPNVFVRSELLLLLLFLPKPDDSNVVPWREPPKLLLPKSER